ncbi:MAG: V-type ATPase subunit [Clostridia bacterium]|nr:V-type ATPase subunit [Clostridia bacterium]
MSKSANAILALCRAYYGKRLLTADYDALLACASLPEFVAALRSRGDYAADVTPTVLGDLRAKTLEGMCEKHRFDRFVTLCRFELAIGNRFYQYFILRIEIDQILKSTLLLFGGKKEDYLMGMHPFMDKHLSIDLFALGRANSLEEIGDALQKTRYGSIYRGCLSAGNRSYLTFEQAFEAYFSNEVKALVKTCFSGKEEKALHDLICRSLDCRLIATMLRTLTYYGDHLPLSTLVSPALVTMTLFDEGQLRRFSACETADDVLAVLERSPYAGWLTAADCAHPETQLQRRLLELCRKAIRFSVSPGVVMFCYLLLSQNEAVNLTCIIEGIKFNVPRPVIRDHLILAPGDTDKG